MLLAYQIVTTVVFLAVLSWAIRSRSSLNLGALFGGFMLSGFDWFWCSRAFWNATTNSTLVMVPGIDIQGVRYPISICFIWCIGFGFVPLVASKYHDAIARRLGKLHLPVIFLFAAALDWVIEAICITGIGVWSYHQAPHYLWLGVVWSNVWFLGGVLTASYFGLAWMRKWAPTSASEGFSLTRESTWKGLLLGSSAILTPAFLLGVLQLFWWSYTHPWVESGRLF